MTSRIAAILIGTVLSLAGCGSKAATPDDEGSQTSESRSTSEQASSTKCLDLDFGPVVQFLDRESQADLGDVEVLTADPKQCQVLYSKQQSDPTKSQPASLSLHAFYVKVDQTTLADLGTSAFPTDESSTTVAGRTIVSGVGQSRDPATYKVFGAVTELSGGGSLQASTYVLSAQGDRDAEQRAEFVGLVARLADQADD